MMFQQPDIPIQNITTALIRKEYSELVKKGMSPTAAEPRMNKIQKVFEVLTCRMCKFAYSE